MLVRIPEDVRSALFPHKSQDPALSFLIINILTSSYPSPLNQITQHSGAMGDATKERLRLDARHNDELLRSGKTQVQNQQHIAQIQAQAREHRKLMLDLEHKAIHHAALARQKALNEDKYQHRERILKLERQYTSTKVTVEPRGLATGFENEGTENEAAGVHEERATGFENLGSEIAGSEKIDVGDQTSKEGRFPKAMIAARTERRRMAVRVAEERPRSDGDKERTRSSSI